MAIALCCVLLISPWSFAEETTTGGKENPPVQSRPPLAAALAAADAPPSGSIMAVDADYAGLLPDAAKLDAAAPLAEVAASYGKHLRRFGAVTTVAPPTMVVLNAYPTAPNIYQDLPAADAFRLLLASLTYPQWQSLASEHGLGPSDLSSDTQRNLFRAVIPSRTVRIGETVPTEPWRTNDLPTHADELPLAHLRLGQQFRIALPLPGTHGFIVPVVPAKYYVVPDAAGPTDELYGVPTRATMPNEPKQSQLDYDSPPLRAPIQLEHLGTVGDLIGRISSTTRVEIYADKHYDAKRLTLLAKVPSLPAKDLLRAVAYCVTGTYRQVGSAFVLTDDVVGVGTRREIWREFETLADARRHDLMAGADAKLSVSHSPAEVPVLPSPLAFTPEQLQQARKVPSALGVITLIAPVSKLTSAQQQEARRLADLHPTADGQPGLTPDATVLLSSAVQLQLLLPSMDEPIAIPLPIDPFLPYLQAHDSPQRPDGQPRRPASSSPVPNLGALIRSFRYRAVLASPQQVSQVDALVASMRRIGLNQLWLTVFSDGTARVPLGPATQSTSGTHSTEGTDILAEALRVTNGTEIAVFAVVDPFDWEPKIASGKADLTILGETSAQAEKRIQDPGAASVIVSPFALDVRSTLTQVVRSLASRPGVAGLVLRNTAPAGYNIPAHVQLDDGRVPLGYTEAARLTFLRRWHTDPVDVDTGLMNPGKADTGLPNFDDSDKEIERVNIARWAAFRAEANESLLRSINGHLKEDKIGPAPNRQVLVLQRHAPLGGTWYARWDDVRNQLPDAFLPGISTPIDGAHAKALWHTIFPQVPISLYTDSVQLTEQIMDLTVGHLQDGFVLMAITNPLQPDVTDANILWRIADIVER